MNQDLFFLFPLIQAVVVLTSSLVWYDGQNDEDAALAERLQAFQQKQTGKVPAMTLPEISS
jgi:hypothetical protein